MRVARRLLLLSFCLALAASVAAHESIREQIEELTGRIAREPGNAGLLLKRAELHRIRRDWPAARADYQNTRRLDPALDIVDFYEGRMLQEAGDLVRAKRALDRFLSAHPDNAEARWIHARVEGGLGRPAAAAEEFARALEGMPQPRPEHFLEQARALAAAGRTDQALASFDAGMRRLGPVIALEVAAIDFEVQLARYDAALTRLARILDRSPRKETWLMRRGEILRQAGRRQEARDAFLQAVQALDALPAHLRAARAMQQLERQCQAALAATEPGPARKPSPQ